MLMWYHPYSEYVRFLCCVPCTGPCDTEQCMVVSGAKGFCSQMLVPKIRNAQLQEYDDKLGVLILREAYSSRTTRQMKLLEENSNSFLESHKSVRRMILQGGFRDGTHIIQSQDEGGELTAVSTEVTDTNQSTSSEVEYREQCATNPKTYNYSNRTSEVEDSIIEESGRPQIHIAAALSRETFKIKLGDGETLQVTCSKPAKLEVLLAELQVHIPLPENQRHLLVYSENTSSECLTNYKIKTQEELDGYLQLKNRPPLTLSTDQPTEDTSYMEEAMVSTKVVQYPDFVTTHKDS